MQPDTTTASTLARPALGARSKPNERRKPGLPGRIWWFIAPALVFYAFVTLIPSIRGISDAFTDWDGISITRNFVGLKNFIKIFSDRAALAAIGQTLTIAVAVTVIQNLVGLLLALGIASRIRSRKILSVILFAPAVVTPLVTAYVWKFMYTPGGPLFSIFDMFGIGDLTPSWLGDHRLALWSVIAVIIWQFAGYSMVIFLAGLQAIPKDIVEAAELDGAGSFASTLFIKLPLLGPAFLVNIMLSLTSGLKQFDLVWVMTAGGPGTSTHTISTLIYQNAFQFGYYGFSIALAVMLTLIAIPVSLVQFRIATRSNS
ncbi:MAG TPA: sugar ABC transporter permease [Devosia sp.]|nr:sugar ABC transporter permease [Devosia sp.]